MKDQSEVVLTPNNPLGDSKDTEALKQKYLEAADIVEVSDETETAEIIETSAED